MDMERVIRGVLYHRILDSRSMETVWLAEIETGYAISGMVTASHENEPLEVTYRIEVDPEWRSRSARIVQKRSRDERSLVLAVNPDGIWSVNGDIRADLSPCTDIDLGITPSTNALPINRTHLAIGEEIEIVAAWVRFPDLDLIPARQRYARQGSLTYQFTGVETGFQATLHVDRFGFPHLYEGIWARLAEWPRSDQPG
jgi:hypothetical protein